MTRGEFRALFLTRLNRDDCDNALADGFIREGITRIQREVRAPFQERVQYVDATETSGPVESIQIPQDYLEGLELLVGGVPLAKKSLRELMRDPVSGPPRAFARFGNTLYLRGPCPVGSRVELLYLGSFTGLANDDDTNELLTVAPDLLLYAALGPAGSHFQHEKLEEWEAFYTNRRDTLNDQALRDELSGGPMAIAPLYTDPGY